MSCWTEKMPYISCNSATVRRIVRRQQYYNDKIDPYLNALRKERIPVSIFLVNGIKLQGQIESFDQFVILLKNTVSQMVYKHAISTVVPARPVKLPAADEMKAED